MLSFDYEGKRQKAKLDNRDERRKYGFRDQPSKIRNQNAHTAISTQNTQLIYGVPLVLELLRAAKQRIEKILFAEGGHEKRLNDLFDLDREHRVTFQKIPRANLSRFVEEGANH